MTLEQAIVILQAAAHEADQHRKMAVSVHDRDKNNKFIEIRQGYLDAIATLQAHQRAGLVVFDKRLMSLYR